MPDMAFNKSKPMPWWMSEETETTCRAYLRAAWRAQPAWVDRRAIREVYSAARRTGTTVDHIVPLRHPDVCGLHVPWNMRLVGARENFREGNRRWPGMWHEQQALDLGHEPHQCRLALPQGFTSHDGPSIAFTEPVGFGGCPMRSPPWYTLGR